MNKNIMLSGPDGVGKSSIAEELRSYYESNGLFAEVIWIRFHHYFQKIMNFFGRMIGKSYDEKYEWGKDNYHDYQSIFGIFYILAAFIDHLIFKVFIKRNLFKDIKVYIIDRYIIDIAADLIVDTNNPKIVFFFFESFIKKELMNSKSFIIECDMEIVISRRKDISDDKKYKDKINAYELIATKFSIDKIDTGILTIGEAIEKIIKK